VEGQELSTVNGFEDILVGLDPVAANVFSPLSHPMTANGTSIEGVFGDYRLSVEMPGLKSFFVKEARLESSDILHRIIRIDAPVSGMLDILLSPNGGRIDGTLQDEDAKPVPGLNAVLIPDRLRDSPDLYKTAAADENGRFTMEGIAPGNYKLFAWEALEDYSYFDPNVLRDFEQKGRPIHISEGSKMIAQVQVITAPQ
jgi:hypothetical protein